MHIFFVIIASEAPTQDVSGTKNASNLNKKEQTVNAEITRQPQSQLELKPLSSDGKGSLNRTASSPHQSPYSRAHSEGRTLSPNSRKYLPCHSYAEGGTTFMLYFIYFF